MFFLRSLKRWRKALIGHGDGYNRSKSRPRLVAHKLSEEEYQRILLTCNEPESPLCDQGRSCQLLPIRGFTSERSAASTVCSTTMARQSVAVKQCDHRNQGQCQGSGLRSKQGVELGHQLSDHHRRRDLAVPLPGDRSGTTKSWYGMWMSGSIQTLQRIW